MLLSAGGGTAPGVLLQHCCRWQLQCYTVQHARMRNLHQGHNHLLLSRTSCLSGFASMHPDVAQQNCIVPLMATPHAASQSQSPFCCLQITVVRGDISALPQVYGVEAPRDAPIREVYSKLRTLLELPEDIRLIPFCNNHGMPV